MSFFQEKLRREVLDRVVLSLKRSAARESRQIQKSLDALTLEVRELRQVLEKKDAP